MKRFLLLMLLFVGGSAFASTTITVQVYNENGYFCTGKLRYFIHNNAPTLVADCPGASHVVAFYPNEGACISTTDDKYGSRFWLTSPYMVGGRVRDYQIAIFAPDAEGGYALFFKTAPADRSSLSPAKFKYVISPSDRKVLFQSFLSPAIDLLRIVQQRDLFGDGVLLD